MIKPKFNIKVEKRGVSVELCHLSSHLTKNQLSLQEFKDYLSEDNLDHELFNKHWITVHMEEDSCVLFSPRDEFESEEEIIRFLQLIFKRVTNQLELPHMDKWLKDFGGVETLPQMHAHCIEGYYYSESLKTLTLFVEQRYPLAHLSYDETVSMVEEHGKANELAIQYNQRYPCILEGKLNIMAVELYLDSEQPYTSEQIEKIVLNLSYLR